MSTRQNLSAEESKQVQDKWITSDKDIRGGEPIIKGSRVSVHMLAARMRHGESDTILDEDFPHIPQEAREAAAQYAKSHPDPRKPSSLLNSDQSDRSSSTYIQQMVALEHLPRLREEISSIHSSYRGTSLPSEDIATKLPGLDNILILALQAWAPAMVVSWMTSSNGFLEGAQPMTVVMQGGSAEVVGALNATLSGAYA